MKRLLMILVTGLILMLFSGCGLLRPRYVPVETRVDSVYVERLVERVDTLKIPVPVETVMEVSDTSSYLETSVAESWAEVDSFGRLYHKLSNKDVELEKEVVYLDKVIEQRVEVEKEVPVEVEKIVEVVPRYYRWVSFLFWGLLVGFVIFIVVRVKYRF